MNVRTTTLPLVSVSTAVIASACGGSGAPARSASPPTTSQRAATSRAPDVTFGELCSPDTLVLGWGGKVSEQTGQHSLLLTLTNRSTTPCWLEGYPALALLDSTGAPLPLSYREAGDAMVTSQPPQPVDLLPGQAAYVMANKYRCDRGDRGTAASVKVTPPGVNVTLFLTWGPSPQMTSCGPGDPGSVVDVSPIEPSALAVRAR